MELSEGKDVQIKVDINDIKQWIKQELLEITIIEINDVDSTVWDKENAIYINLTVKVVENEKCYKRNNSSI